MSKIGNLFFFFPDFPGLPAVPAVSQALFQPRCPAAHAPGEFFWDKTWEFQRGDSLGIPGFAASTHPWLKTFFRKRIPGWFGWVDRSTSHLSQVVPANPAFLERKIFQFSMEKIPGIWLFLGIFVTKALSGNSSFMKGVETWEESTGKKKSRDFNCAQWRWFFCGNWGRGRVFIRKTSFSMILRKIFKLNQVGLFFFFSVNHLF